MIRRYYFFRRRSESFAGNGKHYATLVVILPTHFVMADALNFDTPLGNDDRDIMKLIETVKNGIRYSVFAGLVTNSPFSLTEWSRFLHLSERSMQRYKKEKKTFDPLYA